VVKEEKKKKKKKMPVHAMISLLLAPVGHHDSLYRCCHHMDIVCEGTSSWVRLAKNELRDTREVGL